MPALSSCPDRQNLAGDVVHFERALEARRRLRALNYDQIIGASIPRLKSSRRWYAAIARRFGAVGYLSTATPVAISIMSFSHWFRLRGRWGAAMTNYASVGVPWAIRVMRPNVQ
jgi:hypothetical protein